MPPLHSTTTTSDKRDTSLNLHAGDWVEVLSAEEILRTLDDQQALSGLPFMPEMLRYCGQKARVGKVSHKTCDTIATYTIRRMVNTVHLDGLRCDGEGHGGCQAGCLLYWKEAWLKRTTADAPEINPSVSAASPEAVAIVQQGAQKPTAADADVVYRCQATDLLLASTTVRRRDRLDPRFYIKDLTSGNVGAWEFIRFGTIAAVNAFMDRWFGYRWPAMKGTEGKTASSPLTLQPCEVVRVRSREEISKTVDSKLRNRGMGFDPSEMGARCGGTYQVLRRVDKIVDEKTGRMLNFSTPCVILDGGTCSGVRSSNRMFCPRAVYSFWRQVWLEPVGPAQGTVDARDAQADGLQADVNRH